MTGQRGISHLPRPGTSGGGASLIRTGGETVGTGTSQDLQVTIERGRLMLADLWGVVLPDDRIDLAEMPTISVFYGILIRMFYNDHPPPHFHARYGEFEATVDIGTLEVIEGQLPRRALNLVREWAMMHREELLEDWRFCRENTAPAKIEPLA